MKLNGRTVGYAMITPAQIGKAVDEYLATNPDVFAKPVSCIYNGNELPPLPAWDKTAYPYAFIRKFGIDMYLVLSDTYEFHQHPTAGTWCVKAADDYINYKSDRSGTLTETVYAPWEQCEQVDIPSCAIKNVIWANFNIVNSDGSVYLAASDPVPVYPDGAAIPAVLYTEQTLTDAQKTQAKKNIGAEATQVLDLSDYGIDMMGAMMSAMNGQTFAAIDCSAFISAASRILEQNKVPLFYEPNIGVYGFVNAMGLDYQLVASIVGQMGDNFFKADVVFLNEGIHLFVNILNQGTSE